MGQSVCKCCQCCRHPNGTKTIGDKYPFDTPSNLLSYKRPNGTHSPVGHYRDPETGKLITFSVSAMNIEDMDIYRSAAMKQPIELHQDKSRPAGDGSHGADGSGDNYDPPVFIQKLKDVTIKVGTRAKLEVEISSTTNYKVTWYRNHMQVLAGEEYIVENLGDVHSVEIVCLSVQDGGEWICMAENTSGRIFSSCTIQALVPKAYKEPVFFEELQALLTEDGTVSLECKVVGVPTPTLRWFKDGREIKAGDMFALTANPKDPTSLGTYTCEASNCMGKSYSSSRVTVLGRVGREELKAIHSGIPSGQPPIFTQEMKDEKIKIGESLIVSCQIAVPPWPKSIQWMNAQGPVDTSPGGRYHMLADGLGGYMLEISSLEICDQGTWKCVATSGDNSVAVSKSEITLSIPKNYRKPCFMEKLKAVLTEDGLVSFECKVVGFPTPYLRWFKDGVELKPGDVYQLTGTNSLGSYNCIARNCMGEASSSAELTLEDIRHQLSQEERLQLLSQSQPPKFIRGLKSCEVKINEGFRFTVHVSSPEPTKVEWYRDDTPIKSEPDLYAITKGAATGVFHLDIIRCEFQDQAEWKCLVTNEFGQSETSCFLRLSIPKHFKKPRFLQCLKAVLSKEGTVSLECKVIGVPQPVLKWYKDGAELKPGDIHRIISGQDGTCCLGTYTCEARNCMGVVSSCASLLSLEDYAQPDLPKKKGELLHNLSLSTIHEEGSSVTFGTPASQIFETPPEQQTANADEQGELSFSFDGKDISVSFYDTPDLTNDEALQIVEMYADQLSEHISEHNVLELPPLRIIRETSTTGNLLMEGVVIDVLPEYFTATEEDLNTEADIEDFSTTSDVSHYKTGSGKSREGSMVSEPKIPKVKSDSSPSAEVFYSLSHSKHSSKESSDDEKSQTRALELETESYMSARSVRNSMEIEEDLSNVFKVDIITEPERDDDIPGSQEPTPVPPRKPRRKNGKGKRRLSHSSSEEKSLTDSEKSKTGKKRKSSKSSEDGKEKLISDDAKVHGLDKGEQAVPEAIKFSDLSEDIKVLQENENYLLDLLRDNLNEIDKRLGIIEEELSVKSIESTSLTTQKSFEILNSIARPIKELRQCVCLKQDTKEKVSVSDIILPTIFDLLQNLNIAQKCMESSRNILVQKTSSRIVEMVDQDLINGLDLITDIVKLENTQMKILSNTAEDTSVLSVIDKVKNTVKDMRATASKKKLTPEKTKETEQKSESEASAISLQTGKLSALEMIENLMSEKVEMLKYAGFPEQEAKMVENEINALQVAENVIVEKASELINLNLGGQQSDAVKIVEHLISQKKDEMRSSKLPREKIKVIETQINALQMVEKILTGKPLKAEISKPEIKKLDRSIKILQDIEMMKSDKAKKAQVTDLQPQEAKKVQVELQALEVVDKLIIEKIQQLEQFGQTEHISQMDILQTVENLMMEKVDDLKYSGLSAERSKTLENQIKALQIVENIIMQQTGERTLPRTQKGEISESEIQLASAILVENKLVKNIEKVIENKKELLQTKLTPEQAKTANLEIEALETVHELVIEKSKHVQIADVKSDQETLEIIENIIVEKSEELKTVKNKPAQAKAVLQKELNSLQVVKNLVAEEIKSVQLEKPKAANILGEKLEVVEGIVNLKQERINLLKTSDVSESKKLQAEISSLEVVEDLIKKQSEQLVHLKGSNVGVIEAIACLEEEKLNELKTPDLKKAQITEIENELQSLQVVKEVIISKGSKIEIESKAKILQEIENVIKDKAGILQETEIKSLDVVKKLINTAEIKSTISEGNEGVINAIECIVEEKLKDLKTPGLKKAQITDIENDLQSLQTVKEVIFSKGAKPTTENKAKILREIENVIKDNAGVLQEFEIKSLDTVKHLINTTEIKPTISVGKEGIIDAIECIVEEKLKDLKTPGLKKAQITNIENDLQSLQTVKEVIFSKGAKPTTENKAKILREIENVIKDNAGVLQEFEIKSLDTVKHLINTTEIKPTISVGKEGIVDAIDCIVEEKLKDLKTPGLKKAQITNIENDLQSLQTVKEVIFSKGEKPTTENKAKILREIENVIKDNAGVLQEFEIKSLDTVKHLINTTEIKPTISVGKEGIIDAIECIVEEKLKDLKTPGLKKAQITDIENDLQSLQTVKEVIFSKGEKPTTENKAKILQEIENVIKDNAGVLQEFVLKSLDTVKHLMNTTEIKPTISVGKEGIVDAIECIVEEKLKDLKTPGLKKAQITEIENELQSLQTVKDVISSKGEKPTTENKAKILQEIETVIKDNAGVLQEFVLKSLDTVKNLISFTEIKETISEGKEGIVNIIECVVEEKLKDLKTPGLKKAQITEIENELQSLQTVKEVISSKGEKPTTENKAKILQEIETVIKDNAGVLQEFEIKSLDTVKHLINTTEIKPTIFVGKEGIVDAIECIVEEKLKDLKTPGLKKAQITEIENELQSLQTVKEVIFSKGAKVTTENKVKILQEIDNVLKDNAGVLQESEIKSLDTVKNLINNAEIKPTIAEGKEGVINAIECVVEEKLKVLETSGLKKAKITEIENELQSLQTVKEVIFSKCAKSITEHKAKILQEMEQVIIENTAILQDSEIKSLDTVKKLINAAEIKTTISEGKEGIVNAIECIVEEKLKKLKTPGLKKAEINEIENELQSLQTVKKVIFSTEKEPINENKTKILQEIENVIKEKKGELKNTDIECLKTVKTLINAAEIQTNIPEGKVGVVKVIENLITDKLDDLKFIGISAQRVNLLQGEINALQTVENIIVGKTEIPPQVVKPLSVAKIEILDEIESLLTEKILELQSPISPEKTQQMQNETYALQITHKVITDNAEKIKQQGNLSIKTGALETVKQIMNENAQELILTHATPEKLRQIEEDLKAVALVEKILTVKTEPPKALEQIEQIAAQKIQKLETTTISNAKSKALKAEISALETVENVICEAIQQENISVQTPIENVIEQLITEKTENLKSGIASVETAKQTETEVAALKTVQQIVFESGKAQESTTVVTEKAESLKTDTVVAETAKQSETEVKVLDTAQEIVSKEHENSKPETMPTEQIERETSAAQPVVQEIIPEETKIPKADSIKIVENLVSKKEKDLSVTKITNEQAIKLTKEKDALQSVEKLINEKLEIVKAIAGDELLTSEDKTSAIIQIIEILMREGMEELKYPGLSAKKVKHLQNEIEALQAVENIILEAKAVKSETLHVLEKLKTEKAVESSEPELQALEIVEQLILEKTDDLNIADITPLQTKEIKGESRALQVLENLERETIDKLEKTGEKKVEKEINALKIVEKLVAAKTEKPVVYIQALQSVETLKEEKVESLKTLKKSTVDRAKINDDISALETFENIIAENSELLQSIKPAAETASTSSDEVTFQVVETLLTDKLLSLSTDTTQKDEKEISALQTIENVLLEKAIATQAVETIQQLNAMQTLNTIALEKTDELKQLPVVDAKAKKVKQDITALAIVKNIICDKSQNLKVINVEAKPLQGELVTLNIVEDLMSEKEKQAKERNLSNEQLEVVKKEIEALQVVESLIKEKTEIKEVATVTEIKPLQTIEEIVTEKVTLLKDASLETAEKIEQQIDALQVVQNIIFEKGEELKTLDVGQEGVNAELKMVEQFLVDKAEELSQPNVSKHQKEESKKEMVALVVVENMLMEKAREVKIENISDKEVKQAIVESSALNVVETLISEKTEELKTVEASSKDVKKVLSELQSLQAVENIILEKVSELDVKDIKLDSENAILSVVENAVKEKVEKLQLERLPSAEAKVVKSEIVALQTIENMLAEKQHAKISTVSKPVAHKADLGLMTLHVIENLITEKTETMKESSVQTENVKKVEEALQVVEHLFEEKAEELKIAEAATKQVLESMDSTGQCALEEIVALNTLEQLTTEKAKELKQESVSTEHANKIQSELFALKVAENLLSEKVQELKPYQISVQIAKEIKEGNQALQTIENLVIEKTGELNDEEVAPIKARILKGDLDALQTVEKIIVSSISSKENKTESSALEVVENIVTEKIKELRRSSVSPQKAKKLEAEVAALHAVEIILVENVSSRDSRRQESAETVLEKPLEEAKVQTVEVKTDIVDVDKCVETEKIKEVTEEKKEFVQDTGATAEEVIIVKDEKETEKLEKTEEGKEGLKSDNRQQSAKESTEEKYEPVEKQEGISVDAKTLQVLENIIGEKTETLKHTKEESQTAKLVQEQLIALQIVENLVSEKGEELVTELRKETSDENRALEIVENLIDEKEQELTTNVSRLQTKKIKKEIAALQTVENILQQVNVTDVTTSQPQKAELESIILEKTEALAISSGLEAKQVKGELEALKVVENLVEKQLQKIETLENKALKSEISVVEIIEDILTEKTKEMEQPGLSKAEIKNIKSEVEALKVAETVLVEKTGEQKSIEDIIQKAKEVLTESKALQTIENLKIEKAELLKDPNRQIESIQPLEQTLSALKIVESLVIEKQKKADISNVELSATELVENLISEKTTELTTAVNKKEIAQIGYEIEALKTVEQLLIEKPVTGTEMYVQKFQVGLQALEIIVNLTAKKMQESRRPNMSPEKAKLIKSNLQALEIVENVVANSCKTIKLKNVSDEEAQKLDSTELTLKVIDNLLEERSKTSTPEVQTEIQALQTVKRILTHTEDLVEEEIQKKETGEAKKQKIDETDKKETEETKKKDLEKQKELDESQLIAIKEKESEEHKLKELEEVKKKELEDTAKKLDDAKKKEDEETKKRKDIEEVQKKAIEDSKKKEIEEFKKKETEETKKKELEKAKETEEIKKKEVQEVEGKEREETHKKELEDAKKKDVEEAQKKEREEVKNKELKDAKIKEAEDSKRKELEDSKKKESNEDKKKELQEAKEKETEEIKQRESELEVKQKHIKEEGQSQEISTKEKDDTAEKETIQIAKVLENIIGEKTESLKHIKEESQLATIVQEELIALQIVENLVTEKGEEAITESEKKLTNDNRAIEIVESLINEKAEELTTTVSRLQTKKLKKELAALQTVENILHRANITEMTTKKPQKGVLDEIISETAKELTESPAIKKKKIEGELKTLKLVENLVEKQLQKVETIEQKLLKGEISIVEVIEDILIEKTKEIEQPGLSKAEIKNIENELEALKVAESLLIQKTPEQKSTEDIVQKAKEVLTESKALQTIENIKIEKMKILSIPNITPEKIQTIEQNVSALKVVESLVIEKQKKAKLSTAELGASEIIENLKTEKTQALTTVTNKKERAQINYEVEALETVEKILIEECKTTEALEIPKEKFQVGLQALEVIVGLVTQKTQESKRSNISAEKSKILKSNLEALEVVENIIADVCKTIELKNLANEDAQKLKNDELTIRVIDDLIQERFVIANSKSQKEIQALQNVKKILTREDEEVQFEIKQDEKEIVEKKEFEENTKKKTEMAKKKETDEAKQNEQEETKKKKEVKQKEIEEVKQQELKETKKNEAKKTEIEETKMKDIEETKKEEDVKKKEIEEAERKDSKETEEANQMEREKTKKKEEETKRKELEEAKKTELEETKKKELVENKKKENEPQVGLQVLEFFVSFIAQKTQESKRPNISSAKLKTIKTNLDALEIVESIIADNYKTIKITNISDEDVQKLKGEKLAIHVIDSLLDKKTSASVSPAHKEIHALQIVKRVLTQTEEIEDVEENKESQQDDESKNKEKVEINKELEETRKKDQDEANKKKLEETKHKEFEVAKEKELEEIKQKELEKSKQKEIEEAKQKELETAKQKEIEEAKQKEQEKAKQKEIEDAKQKELETAKQKEMEEAKQKELEKAKQKEIEEAKQKEQEKAKQKEIENAKQKELETAKQKEIEEAKQKELEQAKQKEMEEAKQKELETAKQKEIEEAKQKEQEKAKQKEIEDAKQKELETAKQKQIEEAKQKELEQAKQKEMEEAKQKELEKAKQKEIEDAKQKEIEETKQKEQEKAKQKEIEEGKQKELEKAKQKEIEEAKQKEQEKAKQKEIEEAKQKEIEEAKQKELEKAKQKEIEEAKQKEQEKAKQKEIEEAKQKELEKAKQKEIEEAKQKEIEEAKQKEIEEAKQKEIEEAKQKEQEKAKQKEIEEAKQKEIEEAKQKELEKAKQKEIEEAKQKEIEEAKRKEQEQAKQKEIEEAKQKELEKAKQKEIEEAKQKEVEEAKQKELEKAKQEEIEEAKKKEQEKTKQKEIEEAKQKELEKAKQKEIEEAKQKELEKTKQKEIEEAKQKEVEEAKQKELENAKQKETEEAMQRELEKAKQKETEEAKQKEQEKAKQKETEEAAKKEKETQKGKKKEKSGIQVGNQVLEVIVNITAQKTQESRRPNISQAKVKNLKTSLGALEIVENIFADAFKSITLKNISEREVQQLNNNEITVRVIDDFIEERSKTVTSESEKEIKALQIVKRILTQTEEEIVEDEQETQKKDSEEKKKKELEEAKKKELEEKKKKELAEIRKKEDEEAEKKKSDEIKKKELEETKKKELEDVKKRESEEAKKKELEEAKKKESEEAKKKQEETKQKESEEAKKKQEEAKKKESEADGKKKETEKTEKKESEETKKKELETKKKELEEKNKKESDDSKKKQLEEKAKKELEENKQKESEAAKKKETDKLKRKGSADIKKKELETAKKKDLEDQKKKEFDEAEKKEAKAETEEIKKKKLAESKKKISENSKVNENEEIIHKREVKDETEKLIKSYKKEETTKERLETRRAEYQSSDKYAKTRSPILEQKSVPTYKSNEDYSLQRTKRKELIDTSKQLIKSQDYSGLSKSTTPVRKVDTTIKPIKSSTADINRKYVPIVKSSDFQSKRNAISKVRVTSSVSDIAKSFGKRSTMQMPLRQEYSLPVSKMNQYKSDQYASYLTKKLIDNSSYSKVKPSSIDLYQYEKDLSDGALEIRKRKRLIPHCYDENLYAKHYDTITNSTQLSDRPKIRITAIPRPVATAISPMALHTFDSVAEWLKSYQSNLRRHDYRTHCTYNFNVFDNVNQRRLGFDVSKVYDLYVELTGLKVSNRAYQTLTPFKYALPPIDADPQVSLIKEKFFFEIDERYRRLYDKPAIHKAVSTEVDVKSTSSEYDEEDYLETNTLKTTVKHAASKYTYDSLPSLTGHWSSSSSLLNYDNDSNRSRFDSYHRSSILNSRSRPPLPRNVPLGYKIRSRSACGGMPATFVTKPSGFVTVQLGHDITVMFRIDGDPKPKVTVTKGTQDITNKVRCFVENVDDNVRITIKNCTANDMGTYCILIKNIYGSDKSFVTVTECCSDSRHRSASDISKRRSASDFYLDKSYDKTYSKVFKERSRLSNNLSASELAIETLARRQPSPAMRKALSHRSIEDFTSASSSRSRSASRASAPAFLTVPHSAVTETGSIVRFQCAISGNPKPTVTWEKGSRTVRPNSRISLKERYDNRILEINLVEKSDAGEYRVILQNEAGRVEASASLNVICINKSKRPVI